jgi:hypothetical protein
MTFCLEGSSPASRLIADKSHDPCLHQFIRQTYVKGCGGYDDVSSVEAFHDDPLWGFVDGESKHGQVFWRDVNPFSKGFRNKGSIGRVVVFVGDVGEARDTNSYTIHSKCKVEEEVLRRDGSDGQVSDRRVAPSGAGFIN